MRSHVLETHSSTLVFVDDHVYKRKKPLDLGFCDFRTLAARQRACEDEVRLNRRLAPDVYEGVATVLGPDGEPCEALVVMRRLPDDRRLSTLALDGQPLDAALEQIADQIVTLHRNSPVEPASFDAASSAALARLFDDALTELRGHPETVPSSLVDKLEATAHGWLEVHAGLLVRRAAEGHVVDGHGDLLADDVFVLEDGPRVLDCLEFDDALRVVDGIHDAASLAMDLESLGAPALATRFLEHYRAASGDDAPASLVHVFIAYRALVRAKVACVRAGQGDQQAMTRALLLTALARDHLLAAVPRLVLVGGLPGSGKSTVAAAVAEHRAFRRLSTDALRSTVGTPADDRYSPESRTAVYGAMLAEAARLIAGGHSVVLDATFSREEWRSAARALGQAMHADVVELLCSVPDEVATGRLERRPPGDSEATPRVRLALAQSAEPWPEASVVDCRDSVTRSVAQALSLVP
jgi:aminoglycoside phosphotransferase family enzyme/predicted kinase